MTHSLSFAHEPPFHTPPPPIKSYKSLYNNNLYCFIITILFFNIRDICTEFLINIRVQGFFFCAIRYQRYRVETIGVIAVVHQMLTGISFRIPLMLQLLHIQLCCRLKPKTGKSITAMTSYTLFYLYLFIWRKK